MFNINDFLNYPMYSTSGLDSYDVDYEMYSETMKSYPVVLSIDLSEAITELGKITSNSQYEINSLIAMYLLEANFLDDLMESIEDMNANSFAKSIVSARYDLTKMTNYEYSNVIESNVRLFADIAYKVISNIINVFIQNNIPYFENILPYKFLGIDPKTNHAMFRQFLFQEIFDSATLRMR